MAKFNHDLPAGEICPPQNGACYWQAPNSFDAKFNHVNPANGTIIEYADDQKAPPLKTKESPAEKKARQQAQLAGRANNPNTAAKAAVVERPANLAGEPELNLVDWANGRGPKGVQWFLIKKKMADEGYDPVPQTAAEAREVIKAKN